MTLNTLLIGHGLVYDEYGSYNNFPIDPNIIKNTSYVSIDKDMSVKPDIVCDFLDYSSPLPSDHFHIILDVTGYALCRKYIRTMDIDFKQEIDRLLKSGGRFYGINKFIYKKS